MNGFNSFTLFPLQSLSDFSLANKDSSHNTLIFFIIFGAVIVIALGIRLIKIFMSGGTGSGGVKLASPMAVRRLINSIGLSGEQNKMLHYVFKLDDVTDPERSLSTPTLLDQHFKRAFHTIESSGSSEAEIQHKLAVLFSTRNALENTTIGSITSTNQIKEETKLTISAGKEKINAVVHSAKEDFLSIDTPKNVLGSQIKIPKGTKLNVLFFSKGKGYTFESRVIGYTSLHGHSVMQLAHSNNFKFLSKRRYRRRQAVLACLLFLVYVESTKKKQRLIVDKRRIQGSIADISVGGCSIKTTVSVQVGARFKIEFTQEDEKVAALGQVLRTNRAGINNVVHMKFLRVTQKSMNRINAYVYEYVHE